VRLPLLLFIAGVTSYSLSQIAVFCEQRSRVLLANFVFKVCTFRSESDTCVRLYILFCEKLFTASKQCRHIDNDVPTSHRRMHTVDRRRPHHADSTTAPLAARASTSDLQDRRPGLSVFDWPGTGVSGSLLPTSARTYSDRPTQRCASFDVQITVSGDRCFAAAGPRL